MYGIIKRIIKIVLAVILVAVAIVAFFAIRGSRKGLLFTYGDNSRYTAGTGYVDSASVKNIEIEWVSGDVVVEKGGSRSGRITFDESASYSLSSDDQMRWWLDGDTLRIRFCKSGLSTKRLRSKDLNVTIPVGMEFGEATVNFVSSNVRMDLNDVNELVVAGVSGNASITASGITNAKCDSVSGNVVLKADRLISGKFNSVSGSSTLYLPASSTFKAEWSSVSGSFSSDFQGTLENKTLRVGNGGGSYSFSSVSGDMGIKVK